MFHYIIQSLKDIGIYGKRVQAFNGITSVSGRQYKALKSELEQASDFIEINKLLKVGNVPREIAESALKDIPKYAKSFDTVAESASASLQAVEKRP